jgi:putative drug exporter of the RND superfamily
VHVDSVFAAIGRYSVRYRWLVIAIWVLGAFAAVRLLPSLSSVTQSNNQKFLPASAPSMHAVTLAAPFGTNDLFPFPVVAARSAGPLTAADTAALTGSTGLRGQLAQVATVRRVIDLGQSPDRQAEQLVVLAKQAGGDSQALTNLVAALRSTIAKAPLPAGLQAHLAGDIAIQVDQQKASGNTGNEVQLFSGLFIFVLLMLIFRSVTLAIVTLLPAVFSVTIAGPLVGEAGQHGLQVSPIAQLLLIVLVLGAGTDYGLFLVFRVREELRAVRYDDEGDPTTGSGDLLRTLVRSVLSAKEPTSGAIRNSVMRVGEAITFSAATVIAALLTLLVATFPFYSSLGAPLAIGIGVMLVAGLTLLPALLSVRISLINVKRTLFLAIFGRPMLLRELRRWIFRRILGRDTLLRWDSQGAGVWGRIAARIVRRPVLTLAIGVVCFGALASVSGGYRAGGFGGNTSPPAGSDSAAGTALLSRHFPQSEANPTSPIFRFATPLWNNPGPVATATAEFQASPLFTKVIGPLNPAGAPITSAQYTALHAQLGPAKALPALPPAGLNVPVAAYEAYRATSNYVSADGMTVQFAVGLRAGDPGGNAALNAVPAIRAKTTAIATSIHASDSALGGEAPALYDISNISNSDLARVIPIAIVAIGILLALVMRSLVAPLYLIASVALSYFAALGLAVLLFIEIGGESGLTFFLPFLMFIFLLALGEDYNILVMTRIREEARKLPLRQAVARAVTATGTTVTSAGLVLAGTFIVLAATAGRGSGGGQIRDIGLGLAFGILMDTFLVRSLLVPSTVVLLGRWNWWPSRMSRTEAGQIPDESQLTRQH